VILTSYLCIGAVIATFLHVVAPHHSRSGVVLGWMLDAFVWPAYVIGAVMSIIMSRGSK
jgi:hypothetical protein